MNKKIHFFNMIEVLLALTVIAVGMTSVLGLFPVGLNASREAIAQNCSADVADQMITYLTIINDITPTNYNNNIKTIDASAYQVSKLLDEGKIKTHSEAFLAAYKADQVGTGAGAYRRVFKDWAIFKNVAESSLTPQMFFVVQGPNCTQDGGNRNIDYSAMILIWKEPVQIKRLVSGGNPTQAGDWTPWPSPASYDYAGRINIELSWPLELPYKERKTRYYQIVINNPNP